MSEQPQFPLTQADHVSPSGITLRVRDKEKAHVMAIASDINETSAAGLRYVGNEALKTFVNPDDYHEDVDNVDIPKHYEKAALSTLLKDKDADLSPDGLVALINQEQNEADRLAKFAGEAHDKLKASKR